MAKLYLVILGPLKSERVDYSDNYLLSKGCIFAVISENEIIVENKEHSAFKLGLEYNKYAAKKDSGIDILSYKCPHNILTIGKERFRIRDLGSLLIKDFEKGLSDSLE